MRSVLVILLLTQCAVTLAVSQSAVPDSLLSYLQFEDSAPLSCLYTLFPSFFIQHGIDLKTFIRSKTFLRLRREIGDRRAVDAIYVRAMQMTNNNTAVALLISSVACFDHQYVGLKVPVFNLFFPLTNESDREFARRVNHLPRRLYDDTPETERGDRDKLQHFFGSAFLAFVFESGDASTRFGEFVEQGEGAFIVGGINDDRDLRADGQGRDFGIALLDDNRRFPSEFLRISDRHAKRAHDAPRVNNVPLCIGVW